MLLSVYEDIVHAGRSIPQEFRGSLTRRIVLIGLAVLVIPLALHSLFLYYQEYLQAAQGLMRTLVFFAEGRVGLIEEEIQQQLDALDGCPADSTQCARVFQIERGTPPAGVPRGENPFFWVDFAAQRLLVGRWEGSEARWIVTDLNRWIHSVRFAYAPIVLSFVDEQGEVFVTTDEELLHHPSIAQSGDWLSILKEKEILAFQMAVPRVPMSILLTVPEDSVAALKTRNYVIRMGGFFVFFIALSGGMAVLLTHRFSRPLEALSRVMHQVSEGRLATRYQSDRLGFELNSLGMQFNATVEALVQKQKEAEEERVHRERLAQELQIGQEIQRSMLPETLPTLSGVDMAAGYLPALEVSGDFYDCIGLPQGRLLFVIADVSGKGISACLYALDVRGVIRGVAMSEGDLSRLVSRANELLILDTKDSGMFATVWLAIYDPVSRALHYVSQGHPPALLHRGGSIEELSTEGSSLGVDAQMEARPRSVTLQSGDLLLLYTDGVIEAADVRGALFRKQRLQEALLHHPADTARETVHHVLEEVRIFSLNTEQADDISLLAMRIL